MHQPTHTEKHNFGYFFLIKFKADTNYNNDELEKRFQFNENIIRYVIVMLDEKRFKQNPRKEPVRKERPAGEKVSRPRNENEEEADEMLSEETSGLAENEEK